MGKSGLGCAALVVALMLSSHRSAAAEPYSFGEKGQLVIDDRLQLSGGKDGDSDIFRETKYVQLHPSAAYFVARRLSVGLGASFEYAKQTFMWGFSSSTASVGIAPRVGCVVPLAERFDLYPQAEARFTRSWILDADTEGDTLEASVSAPVLFKPAPHFFVGLGPMLLQRWYRRDHWSEQIAISGSRSFTRAALNWGVTSTIGGYFDI